MPGLFPRQKVWIAKETLVYSDLNSEFNNIINNLEADTLGGYSSNVAQMRAQTDPGDVGSESLPLSISGEIERIRFVLSRIVGKTYWYEEPLYDLSTLGESITSDIGFFGKGSNKAEFVRMLHNGVCDDAQPAALTAGEAKFSSYGLVNTPASPRSFVSRTSNCAPNQSYLSMWFKNIASGDGIFYNPLLNIYVALDVTGKVSATLETKDFDPLTNWKVTKTILGATSFSSIADFKNISMSYSINGQLGVGQDAAFVSVDSAVQGTPITADTISSSVGTSPGRWIFLGKKNPSLTAVKRSAFGVLPQSETTNPWVLTQTGASTTSVSGGILTMNCAISTQNLYTLASAITPTSIGAGIVFKTKLRFTNAQDKGYSTTTVNNNNTLGGGFVEGIYVQLRIDTNDLASSVMITSTGIGFASPVSSAASNFYAHNFSDWTDVEIGFFEPAASQYYDQSGTITDTFSKLKAEIKINGKKVTEAFFQNDTTAGNLFSIGRPLSNATQDACVVQFERMELFTGGKDYIIPNSSLVQSISDIAIIDSYYPSTSPVSTTLSTKDPFIVCPIREVKKPSGFTIRNSFQSAYGSINTTFPTGTVNGSYRWIGAFNPDNSPVRFISDGITPISIDAVVNVSVGLGGTRLGSSTSVGVAAGYRHYLRKNYFDTSGANDLLQDSSNLMGYTSVSAYNDTATTLWSINGTSDLSICDTRVWPAGEVVLLPYFRAYLTYGAASTNQPVIVSCGFKTVSIYS